MTRYQSRHGPSSHSAQRTAHLGAAVGLAAVALLGVPITAAHGAPSQTCADQTPNPPGGHGANVGGPYDPACDGSASDNGNSGGNGNGNGPPCAGCVGNADDKNPPGQQPGPGDPNAGYECDRNQGVGKGNPAHSGCTPRPSPSPSISVSGRGSASSSPSSSASLPSVVTSSHPGNPQGPPDVVPAAAAPPVVVPLVVEPEPAEVLGVKIVRPVPAPAPAQVAGVTLTGPLPFTGPVSERALSLGIALLGVGVLLEYAGRRRLRTA